MLEHKKAFHNSHHKYNVAEYAFKLKHHINWENTNNTYFENNHKARYFLESCNIEQHKHRERKLMNDQQHSQTCIHHQYLGPIKFTENSNWGN